MGCGKGDCRNAALFGGIAAGLVGAALLGGAAHADPAYGGGYYAAPDCWTEQRPHYNRWGDFRGYRSIRVCN